MLQIFYGGNGNQSGKVISCNRLKKLLVTEKK